MRLPAQAAYIQAVEAGRIVRHADACEPRITFVEVMVAVVIIGVLAGIASSSGSTSSSSGSTGSSSGCEKSK